MSAAPRYTVEDRRRRFESSVRQRLAPALARANLAWPPRALLLVGLKAERRLEVYAGEGPDALRFLCVYPILAASGGPGPKLREGDRQVPEGFYRVAALQPNSRFHLAVRLDYPNAEDRERAARDGRADPGGDIMIHGGAQSVGCLAIGDAAAEDVFVLCAVAGITSVRVLLSPRDFRARGATAEDWAGQPAWLRERYAALDAALRARPSAE